VICPPIASRVVGEGVQEFRSGRIGTSFIANVSVKVHPENRKQNSEFRVILGEGLKTKANDGEFHGNYDVLRFCNS
jgi:hypothetical protein